MPFSLTIPVPTILLAIAGVMAIILIIKFLVRFIMG